MTLQPLHTPEDLAAMLGRSKWWVCEQCRRGRFPFVKPGGSYRFTDRHVEEILAILEELPAAQPRGGKARSNKPRRTGAPKPSGTTRPSELKARPPRRRRGTQGSPRADGSVG